MHDPAKYLSPPKVSCESRENVPVINALKRQFPRKKCKIYLMNEEGNLIWWILIQMISQIDVDSIG